jgi:hypothetical protein
MFFIQTLALKGTGQTSTRLRVFLKTTLAASTEGTRFARLETADSCCDTSTVWSSYLSHIDIQLFSLLLEELHDGFFGIERCL